MASQTEYAHSDAMRAALSARYDDVMSTRKPPSLSRYITKKLNVTLPVEDLHLWLGLALVRERFAFVSAYHGQAPESDAAKREIEFTLHELCADTGYKATIYQGATSGLYIWQIKRYKYAAFAKRRETLRRDLLSAHLIADAAALRVHVE